MTTPALTWIKSRNSKGKSRDSDRSLFSKVLERERMKMTTLVMTLALTKRKKQLSECYLQNREKCFKSLNKQVQTNPISRER